MRLPYGKYTGEQMLDTVEVLAHEKYEALLRKRQALSESLVDHRILAQVRSTADGKRVVRKKIEEVENPFEDRGTSSEDADTPARTHLPLPNRQPIQIPYLQRVALPQSVSLNQVHDMKPFEDLGKALRHDAGDTLIRTALKAKGGQIKGQKAEDAVEALHLDIPLETSRKGLIERVMKVRGVEPRRNELNAAAAIVDTVIEAIGLLRPGLQPAPGRGLQAAARSRQCRCCLRRPGAHHHSRQAANGSPQA